MMYSTLEMSSDGDEGVLDDAQCALSSWQIDTGTRHVVWKPKEVTWQQWQPGKNGQSFGRCWVGRLFKVG
jgi:hypothetical protein